MIKIYETFLLAVESGESRVSEKGILQILLDLKFIADILSGGRDFASSNPEQDSSRIVALKPSLRRKQPQVHLDCANAETIIRLINSFSQRLDPIDWAT